MSISGTSFTSKGNLFLKRSLSSWFRITVCISAVYCFVSYLIFMDSLITVTSSPSALISQLLREASPQDRETFLNLSYVKLPKNLKPEDHPDEVALAIFQTNAVAAGGDVGIFPRMTRLNHGCSSAFNVVYNWREREGALVVHALRPIQKGEVLGIYIIFIICISDCHSV